MKRLDGFEPKHKVKIVDSIHCPCIYVDDILVPNCNCKQHSKTQKPFIYNEISYPECVIIEA
jgi:hypothetical protein